MPVRSVGKFPPHRHDDRALLEVVIPLGTSCGDIPHNAARGTPDCATPLSRSTIGLLETYHPEAAPHLLGLGIGQVSRAGGTCRGRAWRKEDVEKILELSGRAVFGDVVRSARILCNPGRHGDVLGGDMLDLLVEYRSHLSRPWAPRACGPHWRLR